MYIAFFFFSSERYLIKFHIIQFHKFKNKIFKNSLLIIFLVKKMYLGFFYNCYIRCNSFLQIIKTLYIKAEITKRI